MAQQGLEECGACAPVRVARSSIDVGKQGRANMEGNEFAEAFVCLLLVLASCGFNLINICRALYIRSRTSKLH